MREAEAVLVVTALTEGLVRPHARDVRVVTAGMDPARFPWPWPEEDTSGGRIGIPARRSPDRQECPCEPRRAGMPILHSASSRVRTVVFAGVVDEWMKG